MTDYFNIIDPEQVFNTKPCYSITESNDIGHDFLLFQRRERHSRKSNPHLCRNRASIVSIPCTLYTVKQFIYVDFQVIGMLALNKQPRVNQTITSL